MLQTDACIASGPHKGYNERDDKIRVYVNFKLDSEHTNKGEVKARINKILQGVPKKLKGEFDEHSDYLFRCLDKRPVV